MPHSNGRWLELAVRSGVAASQSAGKVLKAETHCRMALVQLQSTPDKIRDLGFQRQKGSEAGTRGSGEVLGIGSDIGVFPVGI